MCTDEFRLSTDFVAVNNNLIVARHFQCIIAGQIVDNAHRVPLIAHVAVNYAYINSLVRLNFETNSISQSTLYLLRDQCLKKFTRVAAIREEVCSFNERKKGLITNADRERKREGHVDID